MGAIPAVAFVSVAYLPASLPVPAGISSLSRLCSNICYCFYEFGSVGIDSEKRKKYPLWVTPPK